MNKFFILFCVVISISGCSAGPKKPQKAENDFEEKYKNELSHMKLNSSDTTRAQQCYQQNKDSIVFVHTAEMPTHRAGLRQKLYAYSPEKKAVVADMNYWVQLESSARAQKFILYCLGKDQ